MSRRSRLRPAPPSVEDEAAEMKPKDRFEDVLSAFEDDIRSEELPPEDLDSLYSEALAEGLLSEARIRASFEALLDRLVILDPQTGATSLAPAELPSVGQVVQAYRKRRGLSVESLARDTQFSSDEIGRLEGSTDPYDPDRLSDVSRRVADSAGLTVVRVHTLLQNIKATLELSSGDGPVLRAARKAPPR